MDKAPNWSSTHSLLAAPLPLAPARTSRALETLLHDLAEVPRTRLQETLAATARRSPLDRAILAKALINIDAMGPKAIGIDILIDQPQPEDEQLLAAMKAVSRRRRFVRFRGPAAQGGSGRRA